MHIFYSQLCDSPLLNFGEYDIISKEKKAVSYRHCRIIKRRLSTMKFIYPAVFRKTDKGTYRGFFPDLEDCYGEGDTLDEAIEEANAAAYNWITLELDEDDCQLPPVSDEDDLELQDGDIVRNISVNIRFYEGWDE